MAQFTSRAVVRPDYRIGFLTGLAFAAAVLFAPSASAQEAVGTSNAPVAAVGSADAPSDQTIATPARVNRAGPLMQRGEVRFIPAASRDQVTTTTKESMMQRAPSRRSSIAFVVVGLAAMIIGSEVDDAPGDLIVLGGAGFTLWGIYGLVR